MKSRWVGILVVSVLVLWVAGCSSSATDSEADGYGFAALQIQWPETAGMTEAVASGENGGSPLPAADRKLAKAYVFDGCEARDVVTIVVEVHDDHERHLVSESFACAERIGVIEHIATGPGRHFIVKALDADEALRYYGEKTEVAIEPGFNDVGVINMLSVGDVIVPPEVTITAPEDGSVYLQGEEIVFEGGAVDMAGSALTGDALVWASDIDDSFGTGNSLTYAGLSLGTHVITLTATDGAGNTDESSISISIQEFINKQPEVVITSPIDGDTFIQGFEVVFSGSGIDEEDGELTGDALVWISNRDNVFGTGSSVMASNLSSGIHQITLRATDSDGGVGEASISITVGEIVNLPPEVVITSPTDGDAYTQGVEVLFSGSAIDEKDGELARDALVWTSDVDGAFGTGVSFVFADLSTGTHVITLRATDSDGAIGETSISIAIGEAVNLPPEVVITSPTDGDAYTQGVEVLFSGSAIDEKDGELAGDALVWTSDVDGAFGTGVSFVFADLSTGTHVITLRATDSDGAIGETSISITVEEVVNLPPEANIVRPFTGSGYTSDENIYFEGEAEDPEDGELLGDSLVWTSDMDGVIGEGTAFFAGQLSLGVHEITLTATDSEGAIGEDSVSIRVIVPMLPDTGQTQSYTATFGEDADYTINPPSYTKLDQDGRPLPADATSWAMVRDNVTGLVWEVKTTDGSIHDNSNRYTWDAAGEFIQTLNQNRFGGYDDWRLPTVMELYTIIHADNYSPAVNTSYFPNIQNVFNPWYLSSTPLDEYPVLPWVIDFNSGTVASDYGEFTELYARAVRGAVFQTGPFLENEDGTVTDTKTGLMWQQWEDPYGVSSWEAALNYCETFSLAGHSDWRLPNRHELHALVDYSTSEPAYPPVFDDNWASEYWASTSSPVSVGDAYTVEFYEGYGRYWGKMNYGVLVRCVRGGN